MPVWFTLECLAQYLKHYEISATVCWLNNTCKECSKNIVRFYRNVSHSSKDDLESAVYWPLPVVPVNRYSHQYTISLPLQVLFILCQLLLDFSLSREPRSRIALLFTAIKLLPSTLHSNCLGKGYQQFPSVAGSLQFCPAKNFIWPMKVESNSLFRVLVLVSPCHTHCKMYIILQEYYL